MAKLRIIAALLFGLLGSRAGFLVAQFNASNTALSPLPLVIAERQTTPPQAAVAFAPSVVTNNTDENLNVRLIGRWSTGPCMTVTATENNNLVYVGRGGWFEILNFADPRSPTLLGKLLLPGPVLDIVINATYAYVATGPTGLQILDIANPYRPTILSSLDTPGYAQGLVASAPNDPPYLYLADGDSGLHAISIANPYLPKIKSSIKLTGGALAIDIRGGLYAYVASGVGGVRIIDISSFDLIEVASHVTSSEAIDVAVNSTRAFVALRETGIFVLDISNSRYPQPIDSLKTSWNARKISLFGKYAFVAAGDAGLRVIDIFDSPRIREISHYDTDGFTYDLSPTFNNVFLADGTNGIRQINLDNHFDPRETSHFLTGSQVRGISVTNNYAFLATGHSGLTVLDLSQPNQPQEIATLMLTGFAEDVAMQGNNYAYVTLLGQGLQVVDVTVPSAPRYVGSLNQNLTSNRIVIADSLAFVSGLASGLHVIDISNPAQPKAIGIYPTTGQANGLAWHQNKIFLAASDGLHIIDVANPRQPQSVAFWPTPAISVAVTEPYVYLGTDKDGLRMLDISNPSAPREISHFALAEAAQELQVFGRYLYVANATGGIRIFNVFDPVQPQEAGYYRSGGSIYDLVVDDKFIYSSDLSDGLYILQFLGTLNNVPPAAPTLLSPGTGTHLPNSRPQLAWQIPVDENDDLLHFRLELTADNRWQAFVREYDSRRQPELFQPQPPLPQGSGTVTLIPPLNLRDGTWYWRAVAWDGLAYGDLSDVWNFVVDTTPPVFRDVSFINPSYPPNWYQPQQDSMINVIVDYDELHPQRLTLATSLIQDTLSQTILRGGMNQSARFGFIPQIKTDGHYPLFITLIDSAGNRTSSTDTVNLDQSPPSGYFSDAPDTVRQGERYVVHVRGATDGSGCGVQYIYLDAFTTAGGNPTTARDSLIGMNEPGIYFYRYFAEDHLKNRGVIRTDTTIVLPPSIQVPIFPVLAADTVFAGESFWVDVQIGTAQEPVAHLLHTRFTLNFDPTEAIEVVANDSIIPGNLFGANVTISHQLDEGNGKITFDIQQANHVGGADGFGSAVRIKFRCRSDLSHSIMAQFSITEATATDAWNFPIDLIPGTASLWLVKPLSDFVMTITPESQTIFPGDSTFFQLSFLPIGRFQGSIQLTVSGVPLAMQARYPTQPFAIPDSFRMIITSTNELVPADYPLIVQAFGADIVHTDTVMIRVLAPPMPDFTMRVVPDSQTIRQGENAIFRASFEPSGGFDALVQLETSPLPAGMTVDLPRQAFSIPTAVDIIFTTAGDIAVGVYRINLIAYGGGIRREQQIAIRILPRPDFIMTIIPDSQAVIAGGRISYQIAFEPVGGFNSSLVLNVSVSGDIEASHTTRPFNIPLTLEVNFYVPRNVPPGVYYPIVTATGGGITHEVTLAILVLPPNGSYSLQFDVQPNPFTPNGDGYNDQAIFRLPESSTAGITILIFDLKGRKITTIRERAAWDGRDEHGQVVAPGAYMFIVQHGTAVFSKGVIHVAR